jgi:hypothetical protein
LIFRFLNTEKRVGFGIVEEHEIGKHLDGPVGDITVQERGLKCAVAKTEDEVTVLSEFRLDATDTRDTLLHPGQDGLEDGTVVLVKVLGNPW